MKELEILLHITLNSLTKICQTLFDFINTCRLTQQNMVKNHSGRILDLFLTSIPSANIVKEASLPLTVIDKLHPPLEIGLTSLKKPNLAYNTLNTRPNFHKGNYEEINKCLGEQDWYRVLAGKQVDEMVNVFYDILGTLICNFIAKHSRIGSRYPPWFSQTLKKSLKEKNKLRLRFGKYKNPMDAVELKILSKRCQ